MKRLHPTHAPEQDVAQPAEEWIDAAAASRRLGVKRSTLYAYVSRGLIRSRAEVGARARRYAVADIERLRARGDARSGHRAVAAGALRWGEPVLDSRITEIHARGHRYRGQLAAALASRQSYEQVAELLWSTRAGEAAHADTPEPSDEPVRWPRPAAAAPSGLARGLTPLPAALPLARIRLALAYDTAAAALQPPPQEPHTMVAQARRLIPRLVLSLATDPVQRRAARSADSVAAALLLARGRRATPAARRAVDAALILIADHELNVSSFASRVAASAGADLFACVTAAAAALSGHRHGGVTLHIEQLLSDIGSPERAAQTVQARLRAGAPIPGFGHRLYPAGDPRAVPLLSLAQKLGPRSRTRRVAEALIGAMALSGAAAPNVDMALVALSAALKLGAGGAQALFAIGRIAGWIAHALEQRHAGYIMRPRARYVGLPSD